MSWLTKERAFRVLAFVGGAVAGYFGYAEGVDALLTAGVGLAAGAVPWPGDFARGRALADVIHAFDERERETPISADTRSTIERARRASLPPPRRNGAR